MPGNSSVACSNRRKGPRVKSHAELAGDLELRRRLREEYQTSFFGVVWFFGPLVYRLIVNRHGQRDLRLVTEARKVIAESRANNSGPSRTEIVLKMHLELQTILCTEYRNSYFAAINLVGATMFGFVEDYHRQRDGVIEADAARIDDMLEKIRDVPNQL